MIDKVDIDKLIEEAMDSISKGNAGYCTIKISDEGLTPVSYTHLDVYKRQEFLEFGANGNKRFAQ